MDRVTTVIRTTNLHPSGLDRSGFGATAQEQGSAGDPALRTSATGTALPGVAAGNAQAAPREEEIAGKEIVLHDIWFQLSVRERQCFGHRFSGMVLKAFGHRPAQGVHS